MTRPHGPTGRPQPRPPGPPCDVAAAPAAQRGASILETLLVLPVLLLVGLGALQFGLVYQARQALNHAILEAARAGSVGHAQDEAVRDGLGRGLLPWLFGAGDLAEYAANLLRARAHVLQGEALGWIRIDRLSPSEASFADWSEPARDAFGRPLDGVREIPNDQLAHRARAQPPAGGSSGARDGMPVGAASGQTLLDANVLRLRVDYGVPLAVPVVGRVVARALRAWDGCEPPAPRRLGVLALDAPPVSAAPRTWACAMYGTDANDRPRMPVRVVATVRMQTAARDGGRGATADPADPPALGTAPDPGVPSGPGSPAPPAASAPPRPPGAAPPVRPTDAPPSAPVPGPLPVGSVPQPPVGRLLPGPLRPPPDPAICPAPT